MLCGNAGVNDNTHFACARGARRMTMALRLLAGFLVALGGALLALELNLPLPWMLGALLATAGMRIAGARIACALPLRNAGQWVIGTSLGLYFTPQVLEHIGRNAPAIAVGMVFAVGLAVMGTFMLLKLARVDFRTAWFSSAIGGASEMATLGERHGARVDLVATAHSLRILLVVVAVPFFFRWSGISGTDPTVPGLREVHLWGLAVLVAATCVAGSLFRRWRLPNPWVLGPMAVAILFTSNQVELSALPDVMVRGGQLLIGWSLGDRYRPGFFRSAPRFLGCVALFTTTSLALAICLSWGLSRISSVPLATLILGTTPGGIAEMAITAKALQLGVPVVTAFHVMRMVFVLMVTGPVYHWLAPRFSRGEA